MEAAVQLSQKMNSHSIPEQEYEVFCRYLESTCGITLGDNKHYLVNSRLRPILEEFKFDSLIKLVDAARSCAHKNLNVRIVNAMTTNETSWFRDVYPFEYLTDKILPELSGTLLTAPRIWSAACSYGHEPYSISISVQEYLESHPGQFARGVEILGTDISTRVLEQARLAEYDDLNLSRGLSSGRREKYFIRSNDLSRVVDKVKNRVRFFELNLLKNYSLLGNFDVVFCRNVLIYFSNENKTEILKKIESVMKPRAWLFLGASEPIVNYSGAFEMVNSPRGVVYRKKA